MIDPALVDRFENPPAEYGPTPLWWWSGATITEEGIDWQLHRFADGGIMNLVLMNLAPKGPTFGAAQDDPVWFSDRWWELFRFACDRAEELGMSLWFYDQIGFSGANLQGQITAQHPEAAGQSLTTRITTLGRDGKLVLEPREHLLGAFHTTPANDGGWRRLDVSEGGAVDGAPGDEVRLVCWRETSFDYLDATAVSHLMDMVHGEYERQVPEHLGSTIVGSFQDELPAMPTWSSAFRERFAAEAGYDLVPVLPALWDLDAEQSARVRADYHRVRTLLAEEAFFRPLGTWHRDRGMLLGADQINPARAGVPTQSSQLYGDYYATHRWFDAVGSDHEGDARIHSSMADLYDHPRVWIESFHSSGWGGTLEETWDWLIPFFRSGANLYNPHASYYSLQAGWFEWAPPSTDFRQPYYEVYPQFAKAVARVSALMTWGRHMVDVALLYPSRAIQAELPPGLPVDHFLDGDIGPEYPGVDAAQRSYMELAGKNDWFRAAPGLLDQAGVDFDILDDDSVLRSSADDGALEVNGFGFRTMILPRMERISAAVAGQLVSLLDGGGRVIAVGGAPTEPVGMPAEGQLDAVARLAAHPRLEVAPDPATAVAALTDLRQVAAAPHGARTQTDGDLCVALVPTAFPNATAYPLRTGPGQQGWDDITFDPSAYDEELELVVDGIVDEAELWNPATGARSPARFRVDGDRSTITLPGGGAPLLIAVWRVTTDATPVDAQPDSAAAPSRPEPVLEPVDVSWEQTLIPTLDNRWGDFAFPASEHDIPLELWQLDLITAQEQGEVRVTYGQELLITAPMPREDAPDPFKPSEAARVLDGASLGDDRWNMQRFSTRYGRENSSGVPHDPRGFIDENFLVHETPNAGETVGIRALVRIEEEGALELNVSSACTVEAWLDGQHLESSVVGYETVFPVSFRRRVAVLELRLSAPEEAGESGGARKLTTAAFSLHLAGRRTVRPELMAPGQPGVVGGSATFRRDLLLDNDATAVRIVTGSATALSVRIDGELVARQEKVEYYEDGLGDNPMYFTHDIGALPAGSHAIEVEVDGAREGTPLFVDLIAETAQALIAVPSGHGWTVGPHDAPVALSQSRSSQTVHARAARRPHPLPAAHWLTGPPEVGEPAIAFEVSTSTIAQEQRFVVTLPPGTASVDLTADPAHVHVNGSAVTVHGRTVILQEPTTSPVRMSVDLPERAFSKSGAAWDGPLIVHTVRTPAIFEEWTEQGLGSWSGGLRYTAKVQVAVGEELNLDLGRVRGAVTVDVDDVRVASLFCAPFRVDLADLRAGEHTLDVTVYGTLAPRYAEATQSTFLVPSQLRSGLQRPIRLERRLAHRA